MRKHNISQKNWYNYQFVPDTSKTKKKVLIDAHYKTWSVFSDMTRIF